MKHFIGPTGGRNRSSYYKLDSPATHAEFRFPFCEYQAIQQVAPPRGVGTGECNSLK